MYLDENPWHAWVTESCSAQKLPYGSRLHSKWRQSLASFTVQQAKNFSKLQQLKLNDEYLEN